jgi:hypothetical protein
MRVIPNGFSQDRLEKLLSLFDQIGGWQRQVCERDARGRGCIGKLRRITRNGSESWCVCHNFWTVSKDGWKSL